ncbi:hypothetical protein [Glaciecola petra]|uniref:Enoyl-CoA hydratase n=1 Tax=Glaciecola petra TaxID=3075602 RepID=A0ABU2ZUZ3_9ALTE|nr:hypothetical protein [Aestuariibacter sp. P117]MDT0596461.1 hypothetical protein [Aestuariibacter sp. P117]
MLTMLESGQTIRSVWIDAFMNALDEVEGHSEGNCGLIITGQNKFFNIGLNLEHVKFRMPY